MQDALTVICDTIGSPEAVHPIPKTKNKFLRLLDVIMGDSPCGCVDRMFGSIPQGNFHAQKWMSSSCLLLLYDFKQNWNVLTNFSETTNIRFNKN
jgi:hypothetical protein